MGIVHKSAERFKIALLQKGFHDLFVKICHLLDKFRTRQFRFVLQLCGNFANREILAFARVIIDNRLHLQQIYDAGERILLADRELDGASRSFKLIAQFSDHALEIGAHSIHLVDERDARHIVAVGLPPYGLGLRLHAADGAEHAHGSIENAKRTLDLHRKIDVSGGIDNIDRTALPLTSNRRGLDGNAALALLDHKVGRSVAIMDIAMFMDLSRIKKNPLGGGCFASIDMGNNADISHIR